VTSDEARAIVYDEFQSQWDLAAVPMEFEGEPFKERAPGLPWARLAFRDYGGGQRTLGPEDGRLYVRVGAAFVNIFVPATSGMKDGATLAHTARAILEGRRFGDLVFNDGTTTQTPLSKGEKTRQFNVEVRCTYDERK
jgi:hypothetical protein